jgi:hypothetical protein
VIPAFIPRDLPRPSGDGANPRTPMSAPILLNGGHSGANGGAKENNDQSPTPGTQEKPLRRPVIRRRRSSPGEDHEDWESKGKAAILEELRAMPPANGSAPTIHQSRPDLRVSSSRDSLRDSLRLRTRSRAASYERERTATPEQSAESKRSLKPHSGSPSKSRSSSKSPVAGDQGLQITIPAVSEYR